MPHSSTPWVVVLAAGEGTRLRSLTTDAIGRSVPKQYCTLEGGPTLLQQALRRGRAFSGRRRLCAIVAQRHFEWWPSALQSLSLDNIFVQSADRGTANGVLWPLLSILAREPRANVVFLPADHFVTDEGMLRAAVRRAIGGIGASPDELMIVGVEPREIDTGLGYIVPSRCGPDPGRVLRFVEKPSGEAALELVLGGAYWNTFIFAARAAAVLEMMRERAPHVVAAMQAALARPQPLGLDALYESLPDLDFSRDILSGSEHRLQVVPVGECGWTDLGTPRRVADAIARLGDGPVQHPGRSHDRGGPLNLAAAHRRADLSSHYGNVGRA